MSGTLSPDGNYLWNGTEWIPAPPNMKPSSPNNGQLTEDILEQTDMSTSEQVEHTLLVIISITSLIALIVFAFIAFFTAADTSQSTVSTKWELRGYFALLFALLPAFWTYKLHKQWNEKNDR